MKRHLLVGCFAGFLSLATWAHGQAVPTATRAGSLSAGIGGLVTTPDYGQSNIEGLTFWSDFDFMYHFGVEGEIHYYVRTPTDISEDTYLAGPRAIYHYKKIDGNAKLLFGLGILTGFQKHAAEGCMGIGGDLRVVGIVLDYAGG